MNKEIKVISSEETNKQDQVALYGSDTENRFSLRISKPETNEGTPLHMHKEQSETFHVVSGSFKFQVGNDILFSNVGDTIYIPKKTPHCFLNIGKSQGYLISILSPGIHDGFIKEIPKAQKDGVKSKELTELAAQFGVEIIGAKITHP